MSIYIYILAILTMRSILNEKKKKAADFELDENNAESESEAESII